MVFQFHIGTIKSLAKIFTSSKQKTDFNSILVRLKAEKIAMSAVNDSNFNSILVRLKVQADADVVMAMRISIPYWYD